MNPRRSNPQIPISRDNNNSSSNIVFQTQSTTLGGGGGVFCWVKSFLKKPQAFPFLLSVFLLLTWVSLRLHPKYSFDISSPKHRLNHHHHHHNLSMRDTTSNVVVEEEEDDDGKANVMRFPSSHVLSPITKDHRGWLLDPISLALRSAFPGGARICASLHAGEIRPGGLRGNHRHHTCNETFLIWGAKTKFRLENNAVDKGYAEVIVAADEVAVAVSPSGTAHALINLDTVQTTFFLGCQDNIINYNSTTSDFNVWKDL